MEKTDYAWFTIVTGSIATISVLADSGLGSAFMSLGGKTYQDLPVFSGLAHLIRRKRLAFMASASAIAVPLSIWALLRNGAPLWIAFALSVIIVLSAIPSTDSVVLMTVNKLFGRVEQIVTADLALSISRLVFIIVVYSFGVSAVTATACVLSSLWVQIVLLRLQTADLLVPSCVDVQEFCPQINKTVTHVMPTSIFTCVQAQLGPYILTLFAGVDQVADLGAITRIAVIFTFLTVPFLQIVVPRIARSQEWGQLKSLIWKTMFFSTCGALSLVIVTYYVSSLMLRLLGEKYSNLDFELNLFMVASALGFIANSCWRILLSRSWVEYGWTVIPISLALQVLTCPFIDFSKVAGVIIFSAVPHMATIVVGTCLILKGVQEELPANVFRDSNED